MIDNELIRTLLKLNSKSNKQLVLNGNFNCKFVVPTDITNEDTYYFFSEFVKDSNCPKMTCYADVVIYDEAKSMRYNGKVYINHNLDIGNDGQYSIALYITDDSNKTMFTIVNCLIEEADSKI